VHPLGRFLGEADEVVAHLAHRAGVGDVLDHVLGGLSVPVAGLPSEFQVALVDLVARLMLF
jgi:hypothetical protein